MQQPVSQHRCLDLWPLTSPLRRSASASAAQTCRSVSSDMVKCYQMYNKHLPFTCVLAQYKACFCVSRPSSEGSEQRRAENNESLGAEEHFSFVGRRVSRLSGETRVCQPHPGESTAACSQYGTVNIICFFCSFPKYHQKNLI